jgi:hypothetical protein
MRHAASPVSHMTAAALRASGVGVALLLAMLVAAPASACLRIHEVRFAATSDSPAEPAEVANFLDVPSYGERQRIVVRVTAPDHDLARRRASMLADLLQAHGLMPSSIMVETVRNESEKAVLIVYPPPTITSDPRFAQVAPRPRRRCGS